MRNVRKRFSSLDWFWMPVFGSFGILFLPNWLALFGGSLWTEDVHVVVQSCQQHSNAECNETKKIDVTSLE